MSTVTEDRLDALAATSVQRACELACLVRERPPREIIGAWLAKLDTEETGALIVALAAMVPVDRPMSGLLEWLDAGPEPAPAAQPVMAAVPLASLSRSALLDVCEAIDGPGAEWYRELASDLPEAS